jgi:hypothetical protein
MPSSANPIQTAGQLLDKLHELVEASDLPPLARVVLLEALFNSEEYIAHQILGLLEDDPGDPRRAPAER